jgi:hypothetical protein
MVEYSRASRQVLAYFNSTFVALIPKYDNPCTFDQFRPISLCNNIYKKISKLIVNRLKDLLSDNISYEQFGFLKEHQIHEEINLAQEDLHSIHIGKKKAITFKVELSKAFNRFSWIYIKLLLIQLGFG